MDRLNSPSHYGYCDIHGYCDFSWREQTCLYCLYSDEIEATIAASHKYLPQEIADAEAEFSAAEALAMYRQERLLLSSQIAQLQRSKAAEEEKRRSWVKRATNAQQETKQLRARNNELTSANKDLEKEQHRNSRLSSRLAEDERTLARMRAENEDLRAETAKLKELLRTHGIQQLQDLGEDSPLLHSIRSRRGKISAPET